MDGFVLWYEVEPCHKYGSVRFALFIIKRTKFSRVFLGLRYLLDETLFSVKYFSRDDFLTEIFDVSKHLY